MWKKLLKCRAIAEGFTKVDIQSGSETSFWFDDWNPLGKLINITGVRGCIDLGISIDATVEKAIQTYRPRRHRAEMLIQIEDEILLLRTRGLTSLGDVRLWKGVGDTFKNFFNTKATWLLIRSPTPHRDWHKGIWFASATPKFTFVTWIAVHNRLATGDRMVKWYPQADAICVFCNAMEETRDHLFFECTFSSAIWKGLTSKLLGNLYSSNWSTLLRLMVDKRQDKTLLFLLRSVFQSTVYTVWRERNGRKHGELSQTVTQIESYIEKHIRNKISTIRLLGRKGHEDTMRRWLEAR